MHFTVHLISALQLIAECRNISWGDELAIHLLAQLTNYLLSVMRGLVGVRWTLDSGWALRLFSTLDFETIPSELKNVSFYFSRLVGLIPSSIPHNGLSYPSPSASFLKDRSVILISLISLAISKVATRSLMLESLIYGKMKIRQSGLPTFTQ